MTRIELIARLAELHPQLLARDLDMVVKTILEAMSEALAKGGRIEIRGFGSFGLNYRPPRLGRNPKTGAVVKVPAKHMPHYKPGKELRERVIEVTTRLACKINIKVQLRQRLKASFIR